MTTTEKSEQKFMPGSLTEVPAFPVVAVKTLQVMSRERGALSELSELISSDAAMAGGILRLANSALFNMRIEISGVLQAIHMLGLERVKGVVVTVAMKAYLGQSIEVPVLRACWRHSLACAIVAEEFAKAGLMEADVAYTAGLMHDVGRLGLIAAYPKEYTDFLIKAENEPCDAMARERDLFAIDHCQAGKLLVTRWNLPKIFSEVTLRHHDALIAGDPTILTVVRRSCKMAEILGFGVVHPIHPISYEEILKDLPDRERNHFPKESSELVQQIASKINSIESV
ncbi:MAG TPA: HDOD domain-containing protein [Candidatus Saccharimonadales bacterium]|jgi:HD-like signal output (HDOD) protein|nr:HDOD domain-containing protein [Candidatus Saccharimonadales bacterium]